jgi:hypothetical protein
MVERTTAELIEKLGDDITICHGELIRAIDAGDVDENGDVDADYEYHARQLIRAIFAFIEAVTFSAKIKAVEYCLDRGFEISEAERFLAADLEHVLTDDGQVVERPARLRLAANVRYAFTLQERTLGVTGTFDRQAAWWSSFKSSIRVRDRLTHPKLPSDVDVSGAELVEALRAYDGFKAQMMLYANMRDGSHEENDAGV